MEAECSGSGKDLSPAVSTELYYAGIAILLSHHSSQVMMEGKKEVKSLSSEFYFANNINCHYNVYTSWAMGFLPVCLKLF